jgi:hypothetical protein
VPEPCPGREPTPPQPVERHPGDLARGPDPAAALDGANDGLSLSQLSDRVDLPRSTVHRLTTALASEGLVAAGSPNGRVRLGPELLR